MDQITALLQRPPVNWWDVIDILVVSILIYEGLKLIRGTRAAQMALGSAVVLLLFYASQRFPLQTVNWVIRNVFVYVGFAAIVLFQSDIRRALSHMGRAPFFRYLAGTKESDETLEEVLTAAGLLAKGRVGALIVLEREIGLRNYVESGIPLDAAVSYDLLTTIFHPGAPMHDGAVIIQENRVAAAACFLPLTVSPTFDRELGTRHRAAIGVTEESDAVAVVVSEERGEVSVAVDGRIERGLTPERLRARLHELVLYRRPVAAGRA
jgi:diadenylate cyclase